MKYLIGSVLLSFWLISLGCMNGIREMELTKVKGQIIWNESEQGVESLEIFLTKWKQPAFQMGSMKKVADTKTDSSGYFEFDVTGKGDWSIDWDEEESEIYRVKYHEEQHGQELFIKVKVERRENGSQ